MVSATSLVKGIALVSTFASQLVGAQAPGSASIPIKGPRISFTCPDGSPLGVTADNGRNAPQCGSADAGIYSAAFFLDNNFNHFSDTSQTSFDTLKAANAFGIVYYLSTVDAGPSTGTYLSSFYEFAGNSDPDGTKDVYLTDYTAGENQRYLTIDQGFLFYLQSDGRYKIQSIQRNNEQLSNGPDTGYWQVNSNGRIISPVAGGPAQAALFSISLSPSTADYPASPLEDLSDASSPGQQGIFNIGYGSALLGESAPGAYSPQSSTPASFEFLPSQHKSGMWAIFDNSSGGYLAVTSSGLANFASQSAQTDFTVVPFGSGYFALFSQLNGGKYVILDPTSGRFQASGDEPAPLSENFRVMSIAATVPTTTSSVLSTSSEVAAATASSIISTTVAATTTESPLSTDPSMSSQEIVSDSAHLAFVNTQSTSVSSSSLVSSNLVSLSDPSITSMVPSSIEQTSSSQIASSTVSVSSAEPPSSVESPTGVTSSAVVASTTSSLPASSTPATASPEATVNLNFLYDEFDFPIISTRGYRGSDGSQDPYDGLIWSNEDFYVPSTSQDKLFKITSDSEIVDTQGFIVAFDSAAADSTGTRLLLIAPESVGSLQTKAFKYDATSGTMICSISSTVYRLYFDTYGIMKVANLAIEPSDEYIPLSPLKAIVAPTASSVDSSSSTPGATSASEPTSGTTSPAPEVPATSSSIEASSVETNSGSSISIVVTSTTSASPSNPATTSTIGTESADSVAQSSSSLDPTSAAEPTSVSTSSAVEMPVSFSSTGVSAVETISDSSISVAETSATSTLPSSPAITSTISTDSASQSMGASATSSASEAITQSTNILITSSNTADATTSSTVSTPATLTIDSLADPTSPSTVASQIAPQQTLPAASETGRPSFISDGAGTSTTSLPVGVPSAGVFALRANDYALICSGSAITVATDLAAVPSPITIDTRGILTCDGKTAFLRPQAAPSPDYDILVLIPPPAETSVVPGFFRFVNDALVASLELFNRRKRTNGPLLLVGIANGQLIAGPNVPAGGLTVAAISAISSGVSVSTTSVSADNTLSTSTSLGGSNSRATSLVPGSASVVPVAVSPTSSSTLTTSSVSGVVSTQTVLVTSTVTGAAPTTVAVQVTINAASSGQATVFVTIGGILVQVSAVGLPSIQAGVAAPDALAAAPVIVNVVVVVAPVIVSRSGGSLVTSLSTLTGFVTVVASGLPAGPGGVTVVNTAAVPVTAILTQPIVVASSLPGQAATPNGIGAFASAAVATITAIPIASNAAPVAIATVVAAAGSVPRAYANTASILTGCGLGALGLSLAAALI